MDWGKGVVLMGWDGDGFGEGEEIENGFWRIVCSVLDSSWVEAYHCHWRLLRMQRRRRKGRNVIFLIYIL